MNGFCMQKTSFPFVCIILDDASTDGEPDVIKKYLKENFLIEDKSDLKNEETDDYVLTIARHKRNPKCFFAVYFLKYNHFSINKTVIPYISKLRSNNKYNALCEGDDYWIDENKLQRQVDFLESHPECTALSENGIELFTDTGKQKPFSEEPARYVTVEELIAKRRFPTASVLYRKDALDEKYMSVKNKFDTMLWCFLAFKGNFYYNAIISSVYRRGSGVTVTLDPYKFAEKCEAWYLELHSLFPESLSKKEMKQIVIKLYIAAANRYLKKKRICKGVFQSYKKAIGLSPRLFICQFLKQYHAAIRRMI
jgi:glycosyltransferase involved in cell wall biosynthesis